jgi:hypothetical protein|tara:strand:+ start:459 stop:596 length:138 start_codon:yes stop_codon:yes gene_type:complete
LNVKKKLSPMSFDVGVYLLSSMNLKKEEKMEKILLAGAIGYLWCI